MLIYRIDFRMNATFLQDLKRRKRLRKSVGAEGGDGGVFMGHAMDDRDLNAKEDEEVSDLEDPDFDPVHSKL